MDWFCAVQTQLTDTADLLPRAVGWKSATPHRLRPHGLRRSHNEPALRQFPACAHVHPRSHLQSGSAALLAHDRWPDIKYLRSEQLHLAGELRKVGRIPM